MQKDYFQLFVGNLTKRNFDNDVARIINQSDRYNLNDGPIRIGTQTIIGSLCEAIIETAMMMNTISADAHARIDELEAEVAKLKEAACKCEEKKEEPKASKPKKAPKAEEPKEK